MKLIDIHIWILMPLVTAVPALFDKLQESLIVKYRRGNKLTEATQHPRQGKGNVPDYFSMIEFLV